MEGNLRNISGEPELLLTDRKTAPSQILEEAKPVTLGSWYQRFREDDVRRVGVWGSGGGGEGGGVRTR